MFLKIIPKNPNKTWLMSNEQIAELENRKSRNEPQQGNPGSSDQWQMENFKFCETKTQ